MSTSNKSPNGWRIAGRVIGVVAFLVVSATSGDPINGIFAGVTWWGILELIGVAVDRNGQRPEVLRIAPPATEVREVPMASRVDVPQPVFTRAEDVIMLREYEEAKLCQVKSDDETRRFREREHTARIERERMEAAAILQREADERRTANELQRINRMSELERQRTELELKRLELSRVRAEAWSIALRKATPAVCLGLFLIACCALSGAWFLSEKGRVDDAELVAAANRKQAAEYILTAQRVERDAAEQELKATEIAKQKERLESDAGKEKKEFELLRKNLEVERIHADEQLEKQRLAYVEAHRRRVDAERELISSIRDSTLIKYQAVANSPAFVTERENSNANLISQRERARSLLLTRLEKEYAERRDAIEKSNAAASEKQVQLTKLNELVASARVTIRSLSLEKLRELEK